MPRHDASPAADRQTDAGQSERKQIIPLLQQPIVRAHLCVQVQVNFISMTHLFLCDICSKVPSRLSQTGKTIQERIYRQLK